MLDCNFDDAESSFSPVSIEALEPYSGMFCAELQKSDNVEADGGYLNFYDYDASVALTEGDLYEFSMYIKADRQVDAVPQMAVDYISIDKRIIFNITSIGYEWQAVSGTFMAGETREFGISFATFTSDADTAVYVDEIKLCKIEGNPVSMQIEGPRSVFVPDTGVMEYKYNPVAIDDNGKAVTIVTGNLEVSGEMPTGVSFSADTNTLTVSSYAETDKSFVLKASPPKGFMGIKEYTAKLKTGTSYIENGDFTDFPTLSGYSAETGTIYLTENDNSPCAAINTEYLDENKYGARIVIDKTYVLRADRLYVFRALISSDKGYTSKQTEAANGEISWDGNINITVSGAAGEQTEVVSAVKVPSDGVYQVNINFENTDERPIYVSYMQFYAEELKPTDVLINAPAHAAIPSHDALDIPINYAVRNQAGEIVAGADGILTSVEPEGRGVFIDGRMLSVTSSAVEGEYVIHAEMAENPHVSGSASVYVSRETIYDGSFEGQNPTQFFKTAAPSQLNIVTSFEGNMPQDGSQMGKLILNGSVSALLSDSALLFEAGKPYVFSGWAKEAYENNPVTMSVIIYNSNQDGFTDNLPLFQVNLTGNESFEKVFVTQQNILGRIMLGFTTGGDPSQVILLDSLKIKDAEVSCSDVYVTGYPYPDMILRGKHEFSANFPTAELSAYRWLISSTADGVFMPLEGETSPTLSVTKDMVGSYLKYEVAPASLSGPVYGAAVSSAPVLITPKPLDGEGEMIETERTAPAEETKPVSVPKETLVTKKKGTMGVINIYSDSFRSKIDFFDTQNHWAKSDIDLMSAAGIVNGRGDMLFDPDEPITRAEFSAFLIRAFSLAPLYYSNSFKDVHPKDWYAGVVETVTKYDIARGYSDSMFLPTMPITREEMTVMTVRALNLAGIIPSGGAQAQFYDSERISAWAIDAVNFASENGLINGTPSGFFKPADSATRAEAAAVIKRMITYVINS
ncbi:MAG: S-layer homology domain-containing protein [Clostridia bacterium]|nr:S-layer homology domain-containing protein [Clostridia bacterium]